MLDNAPEGYQVESNSVKGFDYITILIYKGDQKVGFAEPDRKRALLKESEARTGLLKLLSSEGYEVTFKEEF